MNSIQAFTFVAFAWSMLLLLSQGMAEEEQPKTKLDKKCLTPPPNDVDPMDCCKMPVLLDFKLIQNCASKNFGNDSEANPNQNEPPFAPHIRCVTECMLNETGMLKDRIFQPDVGMEMAKKELGPKSIWLPIVDEALKTCNDFAQQAQQSKHIEHKGKCGHMGAFVVACVNTQLFKNCPQSIWNNTQGCTDLLDTTKNCPVIAPIPAQD